MTRTLVSARRVLGAAAIAFVLLAPFAARAQVGSMLTGTLASGQTTGGIGGGGGADDYYRKPALPSGLPGARITPDRAAPTDKVSTDMKPTDALFDAVNRGDIAAAREALSRGANLYAHNMLGLTPVDLSVDLGHTDITFLLLSMRRAAPPPDASRPAAQVATAAPAAKMHTRRAPPTAVHADRATRAPTPRRPAPRPQVLADDGGTPRPSVGFLGFGK